MPPSPHQVDSDSRLPLALVPGLLCTSLLWQHQRQHLSDVAAITVADTLSDASIEGMARRLLARMPPRFALAGLSMGGYVALATARLAPERVARLVLLDSRAQADTAEGAQHRRDQIALVRRGAFRGVARSLLPLLVHKSRVQDAALADTVARMAVTVGRDAFIRQQTALLARPDQVAHLHAIAPPTLVACGRQDVLTPLSDSQLMAGLIPNARLKVIEDCGHLSALERPATVTRLLRNWLLEGA